MLQGQKYAIRIFSCHPMSLLVLKLEYVKVAKYFIFVAIELYNILMNCILLMPNLEYRYVFGVGTT